MPAATVAVVTDSTACLSAETAVEHGVEVLPLQVVVDGEARDEGAPGATSGEVAEALRSGHRVSTSRPAPARLLETYERLGAGGRAVVSVHLSAETSGTVESARSAAAEAAERGVRVEVVDSRQVGVATGYAALAAAVVAASGRDVEAVAEAARRRAAASSSWFYVDTLEYLRRGGRVGAAAALVGGALAVKPILAIEDGEVVSRERVRTATRALARLADLAGEAARTSSAPVDVGVAHLASPDRAADLAARLTERLSGPLEGREVSCGELGAVLGAHVGPGMIAVCVAPRV